VQNTEGNAFDAVLAGRGLGSLRRARTTILQVNVGKRCDLACHHCHVESGPKRTEALDEALAQRVLEVLERNPALGTLDLTGGAPELNPHFRRLAAGGRALGRRVIDRCNLTVLLEPGQEDTAEFLAREGVDVVASLPCYTAGNVDAQRGKRVYERSVDALRRLNALGYGDGLRLDLVYNPLGASLPAPQAKLEDDYRRELGALGIRFHRLLTITNMPIKRFAHDLARRGESSAYQALLVNHFNPATVDGLMCRNTLSVAYDGQLYDCDFNQALELPLAGRRTTLYDVDDVAALDDLPIATASHCFGCTAGAGSSCGGALAAQGA
jgi:radical SAM/Cys-rich protein